MIGLEDLTLLQKAEEVADSNWKLVQSWNDFDRQTLGKQFVRALDSVGANVAEAFGRFHYGDKINFLYYARGSVFESKYWLNRAQKRGLISDETHRMYAKKLTDIAVRINNFVRSLKKQRSSKPASNVLKESGPVYHTKTDSETDFDIFDADEISWLTQSPQNR